MKERKLYLETLRIIAILCVFFNHTWTSGFLLFTQKLHSPLYPFYILISLLCKVAVPIFLMVSGSLLLGKQEGIQTLFQKRIPRILVALIASSVVYYIFLYFPKYSIREFLTLLYSGEVAPSQWYLYAYLGILLILPFLQRMVHQLQPIHFYYLIALHLIILGILPIVQYMFDPKLYLHRYLQVNLATPLTVFYFIIGYFVDRQEQWLEKKSLKAIGLLTAVSLVVNILVVMLHVSRFGVSDLHNVERFHSALFLFPTIFIFLVVKKWHQVRQLSERTTAWLTYLGSLVFGIYLIERLLWLTTKIVFVALDYVLPTLLACFVWVVASFALGVVILTFLKKIPVVNRWI